jgi:nitrogenase subunit NifH
MKKLSKLGIYMDHSSAELMNFKDNIITSEVVNLNFTHKQKENSLSRSEHIMHNKQQREQSIYYHELADVIKKNDHVVIFGPTEAKIELFNIVKMDQSFSKIKIELVNSDKLTDTQRHTFVKNYFALN